MGNQNDSMNDAFVYAALILGLIFGAQWFYEHNIEMCNIVIMSFNKVMLYPFSLVSSTDAHKIIEKFSWHNPLRYNWSKMTTLTQLSGSYWRWILCPPVAWMAWNAYINLNVMHVYERSLTMRSLLLNNIEAFPCMAPVARRDILKLPAHSGYWAMAKLPVQFAADNNLILDKNNNIISRDLLIDKETNMSNDRSPLLEKKGNEGVHINKLKAIELFEKQVGPSFNGIDNLPGHLKGLAAAFMAFGAGDKKNGQKLLDYMSLSYIDDENGKPLKLDIGNAEKLITKYSNHPKILEATKNHMAFTSTWMIALFTFARLKGGVISTSQFIWLRPMDRLMFYTLNQVGGRRPWSESIGPWVHYTFERMSKQPIFTFHMEDAVNDFAREIAELGFLDEKLIGKK